MVNIQELYGQYLLHVYLIPIECSIRLLFILLLTLPVYIKKIGCNHVLNAKYVGHKIFFKKCKLAVEQTFLKSIYKNTSPYKCSKSTQKGLFLNWYFLKFYLSNFLCSGFIFCRTRIFNAFYF